MKTKTFIKVLSLVICLVMMVSTFAACDLFGGEEETTTKAPEETTTKKPDGNDDDEETTTKKPSGGETESTTKKPDVVAIPDGTDFGGAEVLALIWKENRQWLFPEQVDGENIQNDIYLRNKDIETNLGLVFDPTFKESNMGGGTNQAELYNTALEASEDWDIICCYSLYPTKMMTEGILYDLNSMDFPNTDNPWYAEDIKNWEIRERLFYISNNSSIRNIVASWCVYVNNTMLNEKGVADIEETVINMDWTVAKMKEISRNWASEAESNTDNHADPDNIYGLGITHRTAMQALYHAAGFKTYELDETTGKQRQVYFDASHINLVSDFCDVIVELCNSPEVKVGPYSGATGQPQFGLKNHNAALFISALDQTGYIKDRDDYSVIPLPMKDDNQTRYYTIQNYAYDVWCIPTSTQDPIMGGIIIEAISADDYKNIAPKWWDDDFKYRYSNGDNGVAIFDLIRSSYVAEFGRVTNGGSPYNALSNVLTPSATDDTIANNYANQVGSNMANDSLALKNLYMIVDALLNSAQ